MMNDEWPLRARFRAEAFAPWRLCVPVSALKPLRLGVFACPFPR
jgi:hypothetical protein